MSGLDDISPHSSTLCISSWATYIFVAKGTLVGYLFSEPSLWKAEFFYSVWAIYVCFININGLLQPQQIALWWLKSCIAYRKHRKPHCSLSLSTVLKMQLKILTDRPRHQVPLSFKEIICSQQLHFKAPLSQSPHSDHNWTTHSVLSECMCDYVCYCGAVISVSHANNKGKWRR